MRYEPRQSNRDVQFKRLCGVKRHTFATMRDLLQAAAAAVAKRKAGCPGALSLEAQLLMKLLYWRQYGALLPLGAAVGVSDGTASRRVRWVEDVLVKAGRLAVPKGRMRLARPAGKRKVVLLDATDSPVERPKNNSIVTTGASASLIP